MLNNRGWGYRSFILFGAMLLIALLLVAILIIRLYHSLPNLTMINQDSISYSEIEGNVKSASLNYINEYYNDDISTGVVVVSTGNLIKFGLLDEKELIQTDNYDKCKGYALIKKEDDKIISESYITCDEYETNNYQSWRVVND